MTKSQITNSKYQISTKYQYKNYKPRLAKAVSVIGILMIGYYLLFGACFFGIF